MTSRVVSPSSWCVDSWRRLIAVVALSAVAGCSLALSGPDAKAPRNKAPECDTGKGLIAVDGVAGSVFATGALIALSEDVTSVAAVSALIAAAYLGAAFKGNSSVNECRTAMAAFNTQNYDPGPDEPSVALRPRSPARPTVGPPGTSAPPTEYVQPQPPVVAPPSPVPTPPVPNKVPPPWKDPKAPPPRPAPEVSADWRDFWTEVP